MAHSRFIINSPVGVIRCVLNPDDEMHPAVDCLVLALKGHPTDAIAKAHNLASDILPGKWRFTEIVYHQPPVCGLASDGVLNVKAHTVL